MKPNMMFGMLSIPFDIASGTGYVSSTAKALPKGATGIPEKPIKATLMLKIDVFFEGRLS